MAVAGWKDEAVADLGEADEGGAGDAFSSNEGLAA